VDWPACVSFGLGCGDPTRGACLRAYGGSQTRCFNIVEPPGFGWLEFCASARRGFYVCVTTFEHFTVGLFLLQVYMQCSPVKCKSRCIPSSLEWDLRSQRVPRVHSHEVRGGLYSIRHTCHNGHIPVGGCICKAPEAGEPTWHADPSLSNQHSNYRAQDRWRYLRFTIYCTWTMGLKTRNYILLTATSVNKGAKSRRFLPQWLD
jgi:hypothetical protein